MCLVLKLFEGFDKYISADQKLVNQGLFPCWVLHPFNNEESADDSSSFEACSAQLRRLSPSLMRSASAHRVNGAVNLKVNQSLTPLGGLCCLGPPLREANSYNH